MCLSCMNTKYIRFDDHAEKAYISNAWWWGDVSCLFFFFIAMKWFGGLYWSFEKKISVLACVRNDKLHRNDCRLHCAVLSQKKDEFQMPSISLVWYTHMMHNRWYYSLYIYIKYIKYIFIFIFHTMNIVVGILWVYCRVLLHCCQWWRVCYTGYTWCHVMPACWFL